MNDQHRATDEQWAGMEELALRPGLCVSSCILELRDRIQQLEAAQQVPDPYAGRPSSLTDDQRKAAARMLALQDRIRDGALSLADAVKEINSAPEPAPSPHPPTLAEEVARLIARFASEGLPGDSAKPIASAVIREVAAWLRFESPLVSGNAAAWANLLDDHAGR